MSRTRAFTLIELLIVVAIIAILAAIAVPNFLEAQTRAKVARVKSDMRSASIALESYFVDSNLYPFDGYNANGVYAPPRFNYWYLPTVLSTPISYISSVKLPDPFRQHISAPATAWQQNDVRYTNIESTWGTKYDALQSTAPGASVQYANTLLEFGGWRLSAAGPDRVFSSSVATGSGWIGISAYPPTALPHPYDPTNGTISFGDVLRTQKASNGYVNAGS